MNIDNAISAALVQAYPPDPDGLPREVESQILAKAGLDAGTGAAGTSPLTVLPWIGGAALVVGAGLGVALGWSNTEDPPTDHPVISFPNDQVPLFACPGQGEISSLQRSDRVLAVAQSPDGEWLVVRDIRGGLGEAYVQTSTVTADLDTSALPTQECETAGTLRTSPSPSPSPSPTPDATDQPQPDSTTPAAPPPPPPPPPLDTTAPSIGQQQVRPGTFYLQDGGGFVCAHLPARQASVSAVITDNEAVTSATIRYTIPGATQLTRTMVKSGNTYTGTVGPVPWNTWTWPPDSHNVTVTITASDAAGNTSTATVNVTVMHVATCFG